MAHRPGRRAWAAIVLVLATMAMLAPAVGTDSAWLAVVAPALIGGALIVLVARLAALLAQALLAMPEPVQVPADHDDRVAPQRVDLRGRPERPRAPGCGRL